MWELTTAESIEVVESNAVRGVIRIKRRFNKSLITQDIILTQNGESVIFDTTVDWHEREKVLKAEFPLDIRSRVATCEIAHGALERPTYANNSYEKAMFEVCAHKWADLSQGDMGVSVINDCKYGYDIDGNVLRITLMRAPILPDATADKGISTFRYGVYVHENRWDDADTVKEAFKENIPLTARYVAEGKGDKAQYSYITVSDEKVMIDAVKPAQDDNGVIIRVYETSAHSGDVTMTLPCDGIKVTQCNMMEVDEAEISADGNSFTFSIKPFEVKTFRVKI